ncbi:MAG: endonuclease III, partial [Planctomycetes bacterium]|nr:endonuclease III [Planctomycetota bacterium]
MPPTTAALKRRAARLAAALAQAVPTPRCGLEFRNPYELVAATILSAQCADRKVNLVTPALFAAYPGPRELAAAAPAAVERHIHSLGLFRAKAKNLIGMAKALLLDFGGVVPATIDELVRLPGVGRKTANCVLVNAFHLPGIMVDTHCLRLVARWGLTAATDPVKVEMALKALLPEKEWSVFSERVIAFGRAVCAAR